MIINTISPIMALVFGVIILLNPKLLSVLIGIYLVVTGLAGLGILKF